MKKYTQADFDAFEVIDGIKQCPSGDYSDIQVFSDRCSFGEDCSFGEECSFEGKGEYIGDYPFLAFVGFGSRIGSKVYFFNLQDGIYVRCGCWLSDIAGFRERVKAKNADAMYLDLCDLVERKFNRKIRNNYAGERISDTRDEYTAAELRECDLYAFRPDGRGGRNRR